MDKYTITEKIEKFAPLETQEEWDCSGWGVDVEGKNDIKKVLLCLTVTDKIVMQARKLNCDMIISHHPLFYIPLDWKDINIYSAHTNLDKAQGGTTDALIEKLGLSQHKILSEHPYLKFINQEINIKDLSEIIKSISPNARIINNYGINSVTKIAFCSGSGAEFINDAEEFGAECIITGDLKFHTALDSKIVVYDIGHFESEIIVLPVFERLIKDLVQVVYASEQSPFKQI